MRRNNTRILRRNNKSFVSKLEILTDHFHPHLLLQIIIIIIMIIVMLIIIIMIIIINNT